ncbi:antibiotic biosynthesis monooxygenase [Hypericibacter adhaerens]|jgi:quinol monooxygenase YgiN|uniref:Antibiotic biosynthesis monooxygenase n=1 Tax=Hypericibacter adhaerens TaxID=2602016 RepID=A0A5J6N9X1_9PROT|nr:putative quinol monooxygenase [Hypericibacter adhaerens]QEX24376.1 antibiotic biosynthesis monooxygenase [Hypericibacter adhaerens]
MAGYVIMVAFHLKPGAKASFRRLIDENARTSVREEPGCRQFDVLEPPKEQDRVVLYEIYEDRAAFEAHLKSAHFLAFNEASAPLVAEKIVTDYALVFAGSQ